MATKKNENEKPIETTATETTENEDIFDVYDQETNNNENSKEENNMNNQNNAQVQNTQNENQAQETKKNINWKGILKVGGTFMLGAGIGAAGMYLYEKHNSNDTPNAESAFI